MCGVLLLEEWYYVYEHALVIFFCVFLGFEAGLEGLALYYVLLSNFAPVCWAYHPLRFNLVAERVESLVHLPF